MADQGSTDLDDVRFYHGTRRPFGPGGLLLPGEKFGADNHGLGRSEWVYVTTELDLAIEYAKAAQGRGRAKVVQVQPWGEMFVDDSTLPGAKNKTPTSARLRRCCAGSGSRPNGPNCPFGPPGMALPRPWVPGGEHLAGNGRGSACEKGSSARR